MAFSLVAAAACSREVRKDATPPIAPDAVASAVREAAREDPAAGLELSPAYSDVVVRRWQLFTGRAARHQASGQSFDERAARQDHDPSGAAHGENSICRE